MAPPTAAAEPKPTFVQGLGLFDSTMIVAGSMIGSGIFIVSADIARQVGCAGWLLAVWIITAILTLAAALSYGELAAMMPRAGGQYVYLREAYSPLWGFLYGWTMFMVIQTGTIAAVAIAFAKFLGVLVPQISESHKFFRLGTFSLSPTILVGIVVIILLTWTNCTGLRTGKVIQNIFTITKIASLLGLILLGIAIGANRKAIDLNLADAWRAIPAGSGVPLSALALLLALGTSMVGSLFSSDSWNNVTFTAGEVKNPKRTLPWSLFLGVSLVSLLYCLANVAYLVTLPVIGNPEATGIFERGIQYARNDRVGTAVAEFIFGAKGAGIMAILIMISTFGCLNGLILAGARIYYAMAQDQLFFRKTGTLNARAVPQNGLILQAVWSCLLALSGNYNELLNYVIFAVLIFYVLVISGIFVLRRKRPNAERPYKAFGFPVVPAIYILCASFTALDLIISPSTRKDTFPGLAIVLAGVPVYWFWRRKTAKSSNFQVPSSK